MEERRELIQNEINWDSVLHYNNDLVNEYQLHLDQVEGEVVEKENLLKEMEKGIAAAGDDLGPCVKSLDKTLAAIGVERQAYYSNTITGNHCHVLLKPENIDKLCDSIPMVVLQEVGETTIYRDYCTISEDKVFIKYV